MTPLPRDRLLVHAIVTDLGSARRAVSGGATAVQLRLKGATTAEVVRRGEGFRELPALFIVNDDVDAAVELGADGVHLGDEDPGAEQAMQHGLIVGLSASFPRGAIADEQRGAGYIGCGPVWSTPTKSDAGEPIGIEGLARVCASVRIPVIAIGGIDATNAASCINSGASGVAIVRAVRDARRVRDAVDAELARR
jgi:thiamine-phosphate pyrophosphorylase